MIEDSATSRLLIIDDDAAVRRTITAVAVGLDFEVKGTDDAIVFHELVAAWEPMLVIIDLQMPGRDGVQILRDLGTAKSRMQIILASGADSKILSAAVRIGTDHG